MDLKTLGIVAFVAAAYVAWPNLGKALRVSGGLVAVVVVAVTLLVVLITSHKDIAELRSVSIASIAWMLIFSAANGLAVYLYATKAADQNISTGMLLATVFALQVFFAPIADWLITKSMPAWQQFAGIGLIIPGIYLIANFSKY